MATFRELATAYAIEIADAAANDRIAKAAGLLKEASRVASGSNVVASLKSVHHKLEGLVYSDSNKPLSEDDKDDIAQTIAEILGIDPPGHLRPAMKQASIDNAIVVVQDIEDIIKKVKRP